MEIAGVLRYADRVSHRPSEKIVSEQTPSDEEILERAQAIKKEKGISLAEAMDLAVLQLTRAGSSIETVFDLRIELKPRVAKFFRDEFAGHPTLTVEERLAKYLEMQLNRMRGQALARSRKDPEIGEGEAHAVSRSSFLQQTKGLM
jgi:hypothetical protein